MSEALLEREERFGQLRADIVRRVVLPRPLPHQWAILQSPARFKVVCCGRRFGKTLLGLIAVLIGHGPGRVFRGALQGGNIWWVAPTDKIAAKIWRDLKRALRYWGGDLAKNEVQHRIEFPGGGSIEVRSAHDPEALRGDGLDGIVVDEAAFAHPEAWDTLRPAVADRQGWAIFISTPHPTKIEGNWFYEEFVAAESEPDYERWQRPTSDNPTIVASELARMRRRMGTVKFARECLAEFTAAQGGKFRPEWFRTYDYDGAFTPESVLRLGRLSVPLSVCRRFATCDLAVSKREAADYTVIASWALTPDGDLILLDVVREHLDGSAIKRAMQHAVEKWSLERVYIEQTAYHAHLIDLVRADGVPVEELTADKDKLTRAEAAMAVAEEGRVWTPRRAAWLTKWRVELTTYKGLPNETDDQVDALAYSVRVVSKLRDGDHGDWNPGKVPARRF